MGPDGTPNTSFTNPAGESLASIPAGRYLRYRATLTSAGTATPDFGEVRCTYGSNW